MPYRPAFRPSILLFVVASIVLMVAGCGSETQRSSEAGSATEEQKTAESAGTLVLDETPYQVQLRACRTGGEADEEQPTLRGTVIGPEGEGMTLTVERRARPGGHVAHSVFLMGGGQRFSAERERIGGRWTTASLAGEPLAEQVPDEPLVQVREDTVIAEGLFETSAGEYVKGRLRVICL